MTKVLIAEDERPIARLLEMNLTRAGYLCTLAPDGLTAAKMTKIWSAKMPASITIPTL